MTPTYDTLSSFDAQFKRLTADQRKAFLKAVQKLIEDLRKGKGFRKSLRVKVLQGETGIFELTWAPNGRALFSYGPEVIKGQPHVIWHSIGGHEIFERRG